MKENLFRRKCAPTNLCPICNSKMVSVEHLLFLCPWTLAVWFGSNVQALGNIWGNSLAIKWTSEIVENLTVKEAIAFTWKVAQIGWGIWKTRNDWVFNGR